MECGAVRRDVFLRTVIRCCRRSSYRSTLAGRAAVEQVV